MPDIIVIGAGFAGLSAATSLAADGTRVLVLEARHHLGGRATAFRDRVTGELVDNGQHVLFGCYHETFQFLRRIGAEERVGLQTDLRVPFVDERGARSELRCPPVGAPWHLMAGVLDWDAIPFKDRLAVFKLARPLRIAKRELRGDRRRIAASPGETVATWLGLNGQTPALCEWLWYPLAMAALNQSPHVAAAPPFVRVLAALFGSDPRDAAVGLPLGPLNLMYAEPARAFIERYGGEVRTDAPARVVVEGDRVVGAEVGGESIRASRVIAAVPWFALPALFGEVGHLPAEMAELVGRAGRRRSMPIVTVNLWYDRVVLDEPFLGLHGRSMHWVFDKRFAFGESASHLSVVTSGAEVLAPLANEDLIMLAVRELAEVLPEAAAARLVRGTVIREKRATFSLAPGEPARPGPETAVVGLLLAGDWIETGLPGTIESAVASGHRAAELARR